jgi:DsbC/DsbD-like thiol-disulfide interchange protein
MTSLIHIKKTLNAALMLTLFCGVLIVHSAQQYAKAQLAATDPKVTIDIITPENAIKGEQLPIVIRQNIIDKWHTYWMNPGDSGEEMDITGRHLF